MATSLPDQRVVHGLEMAVDGTLGLIHDSQELVLPFHGRDQRCADSEEPDSFSLDHGITRGSPRREDDGWNSWSPCISSPILNVGHYSS